jgi:hypothetical protein
MEIHSKKQEFKPEEELLQIKHVNIVIKILQKFWKTESGNKIS